MPEASTESGLDGDRTCKRWTVVMTVRDDQRSLRSIAKRWPFNSL
jgi:hypothetical protein